MGRYNHAAVCLEYEREKALLLVSGGVDAAGTVLSDTWLIEIYSGRRRKVNKQIQ